MIWPLFKYNIKANKTLWFILVMVMLMYYTIIISMFDPENIEALTNMLELFPKELIDAMGFSNFGPTLLTFITGYIYGFLIFLFPMIIAVVVNHKLVASLVDKGSMAYLISGPHSRTQVALTQVASSIFSITLFFICTTITTAIASHFMFPNELDLSTFIYLNFYTIILYWAISSIAFFASCIADDSKISLSIGVGFPVAFLVIQMLSGVGEDFKWLEYFTMYSLFNPDLLIQNDSFVIIGMISLLSIALVLYSLGVYIFNKKNLYI
jgi:ABC-2 type transport system permease protein